MTIGLGFLFLCVVVVVIAVLMTYAYGYVAGRKYMETRAVSSKAGYYRAGDGQFAFGRNPAEKACEELRKSYVKDTKAIQDEYDAQLRSKEDQLNEVYNELEEKDNEVLALNREIRAYRKGKKGK